MLQDGLSPLASDNLGDLPLRRRLKQEMQKQISTSTRKPYTPTIHHSPPWWKAAWSMIKLWQLKTPKAVLNTANWEHARDHHQWSTVTYQNTKKNFSPAAWKAWGSSNKASGWFGSAVGNLAPGSPRFHIKVPYLKVSRFQKVWPKGHKGSTLERFHISEASHKGSTLKRFQVPNAVKALDTAKASHKGGKVPDKASKVPDPCKGFKWRSRDV